MALIFSQIYQSFNNTYIELGNNINTLETLYNKAVIHCKSLETMVTGFGKSKHFGAPKYSEPKSYANGIQYRAIVSGSEAPTIELPNSYILTMQQIEAILKYLDNQKLTGAEFDALSYSKFVGLQMGAHTYMPENLMRNYDNSSNGCKKLSTVVMY